jgi:hypothetical protein
VDKRRKTPYLAALMLAAALTLAACDGTLPAAPVQAPAEEPAKALAPVGEAPAPADETVMISLGSALQVFELVGPAESLGADSWTVAGITFVTGPGTEIEGSLGAGDLVRVELALQADGQLVARQIRLASSDDAPTGLGEIEYMGTLDQVGEAEWTIGGLTVQVAQTTEIQPGLNAGDWVKVHALIGEGGQLTAREIESATQASQQAFQAVGEFEFFGMVEAMGSDSWTIQGRSVTVGPGTEIKGPLAVGSIVKVHAVPQVDATQTAREIELAAGNDFSGDDDESGEDYKFFGIVQSISAGAWEIGGVTFSIQPSTEVDSHVAVGDLVRVEVVRSADGTLLAMEIEKDDDSADVGDDDSRGRSSDDDDDMDDDSSGSGSDDDSSGSGSDDDNSGSGSDDDDNSGSGSDDD